LPKPMRRAIASAWSTFQPERAIRASDPIFAWVAGVSGVNLHTARGILRDPCDYARMVEAVREEFQALETCPARLGYAHTRMNLDLQTYLPNDILALTDKATMAASVEGRVPLIDHRLVEFAFSLPVRINFVGHKPKGLLKRLMSGRLPAGLLNRQKEGFSAPDAAWLKVDQGIDLTGELLDARSPILDSMLNPKALAALLSTPERRRKSASMLFALYLFNRWHRAQLAA
jgi:asparagine synthetase B (glutamine-hydrolysing)